jgi:citrate synthase
VAAEWLSANEAAHRLGIKRETLYAYVSRGMLASRRVPGTRESRFDRKEIARLAARARPTGRVGAFEVVIDSGLTLLEPDGGLWYRGWDATEACRQASFEEVARWLWGSGGSPAAFAAPATVLSAARSAVAPLAPSAHPLDRMRVALMAAATADPLRFDRRPDAVAACGSRIIAVMVDSLATAPSPQPGPVESVASRLYSVLGATAGNDQEVAALDAALVLLADHEMATSTLAARVAASTWADPYLVVSAGLGALGGPLHGGAGDLVAPFLRACAQVGAAEAVGGRMRLGEAVEGFGHVVYRTRDPRAEALLPFLESAWPGHPILAAARDVTEIVTEHGTFANIDLMLGALVASSGMVEGSAEAAFAVARTAGWLAHAIEEYGHRLRFRLRAAYTGPSPSG